MGIRCHHVTALDFFIQRFCNKTDVFAYLAKAGRLLNVSVAYVFPIAFNVFVQLMKLYFFRELPFAIFNRPLRVHIRYRFWIY